VTVTILANLQTKQPSAFIGSLPRHVVSRIVQRIARHRHVDSTLLGTLQYLALNMGAAQKKRASTR
jgi:hypothetical protein